MSNKNQHIIFTAKSNNCLPGLKKSKFCAWWALKFVTMIKLRGSRFDHYKKQMENECILCFRLFVVVVVFFVVVFHEFIRWVNQFQRD